MGTCRSTAVTLGITGIASGRTAVGAEAPFCCERGVGFTAGSGRRAAPPELIIT
jgi:hypothetical protein